MTALFVALLLLGCATEESALPILGERAPSFSLTNQMQQTITDRKVAGKIHVVDFFFTSCPSICPQMTTHLKVVQEAFAGEEEVAILSYSIDAKHDTPDRLLEYARRYGIDNEQWSLLTGDRDQIFELAKDYKVRAFDDSDSQGDSETSLIHDGTFVLLDGKGAFEDITMDWKWLIPSVSSMTLKNYLRGGTLV